MKSVIIVATDENYLQHAKAAMAGARRQGEWSGDFCVVIPSSMDADYFRSRGIDVLIDDRPGFYRKLSLVEPFFRQWDVAVYLDCDVIIQNPLAAVVDTCTGDHILASREPFSLEHSLTFWATPEELESPDRRKVFDHLWSVFDRDHLQFGAGVMVYSPTSLPADIVTQVETTKQVIAPVNCHTGNGSDQPIYNLVFYGKFRQIPNNLIAYWADADDTTAIIHTCHMYAPWIKTSSSQGAYFCNKLKRPMYDIYQDNLAAFDREFPVK